MVARRLLSLVTRGPMTLLRAVLEVLREPLNWAGIYLLLELYRYVRFRRHVARIEHIDPFQPMSLSLSRREHFQYCTELLHFEPDPQANVRGFFQLDHRDDLSCIPRTAALRALRFYLSAREEAGTASRNSLRYNKSVGFAVEVNGGVELDREVPFADVVRTAEEVLVGWEQRDPKLKAALSHASEDELRTADNPINFSRVGANDLTAWFKPLPLRLLIWAVRFWCCHVQLRRAGFRRRLAGHGVVFWTRNGFEEEAAAYEHAHPEETAADDDGASPTSARTTAASAAAAPCKQRHVPPAGEQPPLFIMHGIGFGCVPYIGVALRAANRQPRRTIVLPEWPNLSFGTYRGRYPSTRELAWTLHQHLRRLAFSDGSPARVADAVGHSYGTGVLTFWMREFPDDLRRRVYIDPMNTGVTFGAYTSYGFEPYLQGVRTLVAKSPSPISEWLIKTDISVQQLAKRATWLMEMWQHDMTKWDPRALCVLSELDRYVNADGVRQWIEEKGHGAEVVVAPGWRHGSCVLDNDGHDVWERIFAHLRCHHLGDGDAPGAGAGPRAGRAGEGEGGAAAAKGANRTPPQQQHGARRPRISRRQSSTLKGLTKRVVSFVDGLNNV